jgi:hypothetical protein
MWFACRLKEESRPPAAAQPLLLLSLEPLTMMGQERPQHMYYLKEQEKKTTTSAHERLCLNH